MRIAAALGLVLALGVVASAGVTPRPPASHWKTAFDLDGDGRLDRIQPRFTGGAHCCYRISVYLSSNGRTIRLPFELDGGYPAGLDLSQPRRFDVRRRGARTELIMQIATYNDVRQRLPAKWRRAYGVKSHRIAVSFPRGRMRVRNLPETR